MSKQWGHGYQTAKDEAYMDELRRMGADTEKRWKWHRFRHWSWWRHVFFENFCDLFRKHPKYPF